MTALQSESIARLASALALAQGKMGGAHKNAQNPHLKNRYADLASVWEACRGPLSEAGLAVIQAPLPRDGGGLVLRTTLVHGESGEWVASELPVDCDLAKPQVIGSALTYARRYSLAALVGVCPEDDDGEAAMPPRREGGKAETPRGNGRKEVNRQFPAKGAPARANGKPLGKPVAWGDWLSGAVREWSEFEPIESTEDRQEREWRVINDLVTRGIGDGLLDPEKVTRTSKEGKRVRSRSLSVEAARWLVETQPDWCRLALDDHLADLRSRASAEAS